ncbi:DNA-binding protein [Planktothrix mougeotii]|uniref:DNA-binding protein n=1 Tax=Planktothrix mougeotii LEGE 06226 TaxID=1828728 RepID=A0ABR9UGJ5_9CYAN|nr:DNA-binding protein [Planktothrix mougeotii]MBE9144659.1 DNA-binding protein [Planktothrix mougeotii LEGE 06226]
MRLQRQFNGQTITLDTRTPLGSGGEGRIYRVLEDPNLVAKIYHKPTDEDADKLTVMYNYPPATAMVSPGMTAIAWPIDLLHTTDHKRQILGYLMPRVNKATPIHIFYTPKSRREQKPLFNYLYLHRTARNLVASFADLHSSGYVIGDVNESNILVSDTALVTLVDTDSFQVRDPDTGLIYRCPVGKAEFTPPELQGQAFRELNRTPEQDRFGLAVLIFLLLMEGTHPFSGVYQGSGDPPAIESRVRAGHFVYGTRQVPYQPMPFAPPFELLYPKIRELFIQCFEAGFNNPQARPDAKTWLMVLKEAEANLITCSQQLEHRYGNHLKDCPWCDRTEKLGGRDPFPSRQAVTQKQHLQPLKRKRKRVLNTKPAPVQRPLFSPINRSSVPSPTAKKSLVLSQIPHLHLQNLFGSLLAGIVLGGLWGTSILSAIIALIFAFVDGKQGILGGLIVGAMWGSFLGVVISVYLPPPGGINRGIALILGGWSGIFIAAVIAGLIFGVMEQEPLIGKTLMWGAVMGMVWGAIWHLFKPPLSLPNIGRLWGRRGAFVGGVWGSYLGTLGGMGLGILAVGWQQFEAIQPNLNSTSSFSEITLRIIATTIVAAGVGTIGGTLAGGLFGMFGGAPSLPLSLHLSGRRGAFIGAIWGNFLGAISGAGLGLLGATTFANVLDTSSTTGTTSLLIGSIIVSAGIGSIWGMISGLIWGAFGKL